MAASHPCWLAIGLLVVYNPLPNSAPSYRLMNLKPCCMIC